MAEGTVASYFPEHGWGTITIDELDDDDDLAWVHFSAIEMDGYKALELGERVDFEFERADQDGYRYCAITVRRRPA